jgi:hypothetical protein
MKRYGTKTAIFLLAVYLPVWLMSSLHVHHCLWDNNDTPAEQRSADSDEDCCLLCQFQHLVYETPTPLADVVVMPETEMEFALTNSDVVSVCESLFPSRAPPFLL